MQKKSSEKIAVILMNLGGPDQEKSIKPFLFNFFMDPNIIAAPKPVRYFIAKYIAWKRGNGAALESYSHLGGKSPLLENTNAQGRALETELQKKYPDLKVFTVMRYWHPMAAEVIKEVKEWGADRIIALPLYPQYSTTTSFSALQNWEMAGGDITAEICCYPINDGFIKASCANIKSALEKAPKGTRLLFSAHGLPEKIIAGGDPYQWQCEESAKAIVATLNIPDLDWEICYQSRVGPLKWIGPSTEEALEKAARENKGVVIYPHAFVSEHVETLVEIDIEYREKAEHLGIPYFGKVETVGTHPAFIEGLAKLVDDRLQGQKQQRICPEKCIKCRFH